LQNTPFDCVVLDLGLPDVSGCELIEKIKTEVGNRALPIIVYTGKDLTHEQETQLRKMAESIIVKDARSPERLLDETALFLHRVEARMPEPKRKMLQELHQAAPGLAGRKILIVDDDVRNIFALTSALERYGMAVLYGENGKAGIDVLTNTPGVDGVLMDIMMPEMDGFETIRSIRAMPQYKSLPIIAVTAKAMKGDREKCIEAGASDYVTKPVDIDQLVSLLRVWLYQ
ncbi:MAG: response regulator, partial [Chloroflexota bacterium]|nr:response regulator [Chloroflexota bacterium]